VHHKYRTYFGLLCAPAIVSLSNFALDPFLLLYKFLPEQILDPSCLRVRIVVTRGEGEFRACWPLFLGVLFLDICSWILVLGVSWAC
jgi:hypothetical protein